MRGDEGPEKPEPGVARREGHAADDPGTERTGSPGDLRSDIPPGETEFVDEPPGSYLREFRVGSANVVWSAINLVLTLAVALARSLGGLTVKSDGWVLAKLVWTLLPTSCVVLLILTCWQRLVSRERIERDWRYRVSSRLSLLALALWIILRFWGGVEFDA